MYDISNLNTRTTYKSNKPIYKASINENNNRPINLPYNNVNKSNDYTNSTVNGDYYKQKRKYTTDQVLLKTTKNHVRKQPMDDSQLKNIAMNTNNRKEISNINNNNINNNYNNNSLQFNYNKNENGISNENLVLYKNSQKKNKHGESKHPVANKMKNKFRIFNKINKRNKANNAQINETNNTIINNNINSSGSNVFIVAVDDTEKSELGSKNLSPKLSPNLNINYSSIKQNQRHVYDIEDDSSINDITDYYSRMNMKEKEDYYMEKKMYDGDPNMKSNEYNKNKNIINNYNQNNNNIIYEKQRNNYKNNINPGLNSSNNKINNFNKRNNIKNYYENAIEGVKMNNFMEYSKETTVIKSAISSKKNYNPLRNVKDPQTLGSPNLNNNDRDDKRARHYTGNYSNSINCNTKRNVINLMENDNANSNINRANKNYYNQKFACNYNDEKCNMNIYNNKKYHRRPVESTDITSYKKNMNNNGFSALITAEDKAIHNNIQSNIQSNIHDEYSNEMNYNYNRKRHEKCIIS